jgi:hypothetical protein
LATIPVSKSEAPGGWEEIEMISGRIVSDECICVLKQFSLKYCLVQIRAQFTHLLNPSREVYGIAVVAPAVPGIDVDDVFGDILDARYPGYKVNAHYRRREDVTRQACNIEWCEASEDR